MDNTARCPPRRPSPTSSTACHHYLHPSIQRYKVEPAPVCTRLPALGVAALLGALALPAAAADFITSNRTVGNGNPLNGNSIGQTVVVGASLIFDDIVTRGPNVQVDVVAPAHFTSNDQAGGGVAAYSNSVLRIQGGTFDQNSGTGFGAGVSLSDTSSATVNGGALRATVGQACIAGGGSVIAVSGGLVQSLQGSAIYIAQDSALTMTGGTVTGGPGGVAQWGVALEGVNLVANLQGGTVNGGVRADAASNQTALQATLGGQMTVNGGVFACSRARQAVPAAGFALVVAGRADVAADSDRESAAAGLPPRNWPPRRWWCPPPAHDGRHRRSGTACSH